MSQATIVSLCPIPFDEHIPTLFPHHYFIPETDTVTPKVLNLQDVYYFEERVAENRPPRKITKDAYDVAVSIVDTCIGSHLLTNNELRPALFVLRGELTATMVKKEHTAECVQAVENQKKWFRALVKEADNAWNKYHHHGMISDLMRLAATHLKMDREWIIKEEDLISCPGCNAIVRKTQAMCGACRCIINPEVYSKLQFANAEVKN